MPFVEQLLYGPNHLAEAPGRQGLAHSAGMGADVTAEVHALCDAWGQAPDLGLQQPVLMSTPLRSTMPSMRGRLFAIVRASAGECPLFHAFVVNDGTYSAYGRNPYALAQAVEFCDQWNGRQGMDRHEIDPDLQGALVGPPPGAEDVGLVDEAVLQFIMTRRLQLPLEQSVRQSDRALALIIACLPEKDRKELKFCSFTTVQANAYDIAAVETEGAMFAGWQRLMMARIDTGVTERQQEYKALIASHLALGDMAGVARVSSRHNFAAADMPKPMVATRQVIEPAATVASPPKTTATARKTPAGPGPAGPTVKRPGLRPALSAAGPTARRDAIPDHGLDPAAAPVRPKRPVRTGRRGGLAFSRGRRGAGGRFLRTVSVLLLLFVAGWVGTMWMEGRTLAESLEWAGLPGMDGRADKVVHAGTLLEAVDVSRVYSRALKHVGGKGFGLNAAGDKGREKALGRLQAEATSPLLEQVALFVKLSAEGIQQSGRPDREVKRLDALANQGLVIEKEMARLELAWYSLTTGTNWTDLSSLTDTAVEARRDSLSRAEKGALSDVRLAMGSSETWQELSAARRHMAGMADVVRLFQAPRWSASWEQQLTRAAEQVSPTAGQATRAYRNGAFALVRLKRAEREPGYRNLPFAHHYDAAQWPSAQVKAILPLLRKEAGRFADRNAPTLLAATLGLYAALESSDRTIDRIRNSAQVWTGLRDNAAVDFDPELYGDFLERLRYEAAQQQLATLHDPAQIPVHLYGEDVRLAVAGFADSLTTLNRAEQWQVVAAGARDPFLGRWASHLAGEAEANRAHLVREFEAAWADCRAQAITLQGQATAGDNWSADWRKLHTAAREAGQRFGAALGDDPVQAGRFVYLSDLVRALEASHPLQLTRVTVRLNQAILTEGTDVQLELRTPERGGVWTSDPFAVGPGAPAGTGWVGTSPLSWQIALSPLQELNCRVVAAEGGRVLLEVPYPSLAGGAGPASLARQTAGNGGTVGFRLELEEYWGSIEIPDPGLIF